MGGISPADDLRMEGHRDKQPVWGAAVQNQRVSNGLLDPILSPPCDSSHHTGWWQDVGGSTGGRVRVKQVGESIRLNILGSMVVG